MPPNKTAVAPVKPVPVITTSIPEPAEVGVNAVIVGAAFFIIKYLSLLEIILLKPLRVIEFTPYSTLA